MTHPSPCKLMLVFVSGFLWVTSGVGVDPGSGTVDLQRTAVEHLGETRTHLRKEETNKHDANDEFHRLFADYDARMCSGFPRLGVFLLRGQNTALR